MTIKINLDLSALERLIGGDTEAEIIIREGVIQTFAKKHLKKLANAKAFEPILRDIQDDVVSMFRAEIPIVKEKVNNWCSGYRWVLDRDNIFYEHLSDEIKKIMEGMLRKMITDAWNELRDDCHRRINNKRKLLRNHIIKEVKEQIDEQFQKSVRDEVTRRIQSLAAQSEVTA